MKKEFKILLIFLGILVCSSIAAEKDYTDLVNFLKSRAKEQPFRGAAYDRLAYITDTYGPRLWGS
jgi:hypothetical protein